jgi:hypothetical protein
VPTVFSSVPHALKSPNKQRTTLVSSQGQLRVTAEHHARLLFPCLLGHAWEQQKPSKLESKQKVLDKFS